MPILSTLKTCALVWETSHKIYDAEPHLGWIIIHRRIALVPLSYATWGVGMLSTSKSIDFCELIEIIFESCPAFT